MPTAIRSKGFITIALLPALLLFLVFVIIPVFWSAYYGFFSWKGFGDATFIGIDNYIEMFKDKIFWRALRNNLILVGTSIIGQIPIALILAIVLHKNSFFSRFVRSAVFMPMVLSTVVVGLIWGYIYNPQFGIANYVLEMIGLESWARPWLSDPKVNMLAIALPINWANIGPHMVIFIAALQNISPEIHDAAKIDGSTGWNKLTRITLPMVWNTVVVTIVLCISGSLKAFDHVIVMTGGGPAQSTELLATYMYNSTFSVYRYGYGSAVSTMIMVVSAILIVINYFATRRKSS